MDNRMANDGRCVPFCGIVSTRNRNRSLLIKLVNDWGTGAACLVLEKVARNLPDS